MWQDLIKTALIGTDKSTPSVSTLEKLKEMGIKAEEVSEAILQGAGVLTLMRKGGYPLSDFKGSLPEICEKETANLCSNQSVGHLKAILSGEHEGAFEEFIFLMRQNKKVLPAHFLPQILHYCRGNRSLWSMVKPVVGNKGKWLMKQNEDWTHLSNQTTSDIEGEVSPQLSKEETLKQAREITTLLNNNRFFWSEDKKINAVLKIFAYCANIDLIENLNHLFSAELVQAVEPKIQGIFKIMFFRKDMVNALRKG
jgi:Family of unknown function (DUF5691)